MHTAKSNKVHTHRLSPTAKAGLKNSKRAKNMARDAAKPHRHR